MKKSKLKYRVSEYINGNKVRREMDVKALYKHRVRKQWQSMPGQRYQANVVDVEINLAETPKTEAQWVKVRLLFVRGATESTKAQVGQHDWAIFLCTDTVHSRPRKYWRSTPCAGRLKCISKKPSNTWVY